MSPKPHESVLDRVLGGGWRVDDLLGEQHQSASVAVKPNSPLVLASFHLPMPPSFATVYHDDATTRAICLNERFFLLAGSKVDEITASEDVIPLGGVHLDRGQGE